MKEKILITDKVHPLLIEGLTELGFEVDYNTSIDMKTLPCIIQDYRGLVINSKIKMNKAMIDLSKDLKFIGRLGSGMEIIDVDYAQKKGIATLNSPEGNRNAVAEHAIGMILALYNNLHLANEEVKNMIWRREENRGVEISGKIVGIIGCGNTGEQVARKLSSWETKILVYDKYRKDFPDDMNYLLKVNLEDILENSDIITLHLPLTKETKHMVDAQFFKKCKRKPLLVNTSRGEIVDTKSLIQALENEKIFGACIDVFENEHVSSYTEEEKKLYEKLFSYKNVIVSPHIAGWTKESLEKIAQVLLLKIKATIC